MSQLKALWRVLNSPCREMSLLSSESLDRDLPRLERWALRLHLLCCPACRRCHRHILVMRRALQRLRSLLEADVPLPGPDLPIEDRERIKRVLENR